jgi:ribosomal protein L11 methyltransferase
VKVVEATPMKLLKTQIPRALVPKLDDRLLDVGALAVDIAPPDDAHPEWADAKVYLEATALDAVKACLRKRLKSLPASEQRRVFDNLIVVDVDDSWLSQWSEGLEPVELVPGLVLVPEGVNYEPQAAERVMVLEKSLVFGFGEHPTTCMISAWLATRAAHQSILDVGCGSGVLAFVAAHHNARSVLGIDIDPLSILAAQRNAVRNGWQNTCTFESTPVEAISNAFDVVVANVDALTLARLSGPIVRALAANGAIAVTGVLEEQAQAVTDAFVAYDVHLRVRERGGDWVLLTNDR